MANEPDSLRVKYMLSLTQEYEGHRLQSLGRYTDAITTYRRSITIADGILCAHAGNRTALTAVSPRVDCQPWAWENIALAESGVNARPERRSRLLTAQAEDQTPSVTRRGMLLPLRHPSLADELL